MKLTNNNTLLIFTALLLTSLFLHGCNDDDFYVPDLSTVPEPYLDSKTPIETIEKSSGLTIHIFEEGDGQFTVSDRDDILVRYTGRLTNNNIFDSSWIDGFEFPIEFNVQAVVPGFSRGLIGMREGGVRTFVIPPELGYGSQGGRGGQGLAGIPPNSTLIFDVELVQILD